MKLARMFGLGIAVVGLAAWLGAGSAAATPKYAKATGQKCAHCHVGAPKDKKLTPAGTKFKDCLAKKKDAAQCK